MSCLSDEDTEWERFFALLDEPGSAGLTLEVVGGNTPIADAVHSVVRR